MAGDFQKPVIDDAYASVLAEIRDLCNDLAKMLDGTASVNVPQNAVRWSSANFRWEKFDGGSWIALSAGYNINVQFLLQVFTHDQLVHVLRANIQLRDTEADSSATS